jgi:hypothetical protein
MFGFLEKAEKIEQRDAQAKEALQETNAKQRQQMIEQKSRQVLMRWKNMLLYRCFDGIRKNAEQEKRERYLVGKFVTTMKMRGVRACLNRWGEYTEERQLCRRVMKKVIGRYTKQGILGGWNRWREVRVLLLIR